MGIHGQGSHGYKHPYENGLIIPQRGGPSKDAESCIKTLPLLGDQPLVRHVHFESTESTLLAICYTAIQHGHRNSGFSH